MSLAAKRRLAATLSLLLVAALWRCCPPSAGQTPFQAIPVGGKGVKLSSVNYFEPPFDQQVKMRLTGAEMVQLTNALFDVKQLTVRQFNTAGKLEALVEAPQCIYAPLDNVASSAGPLDVKLDGDRIHIQGVGFLWRQKEQSLVISNQVHTVIKMGNWKLTGN